VAIPVAQPTPSETLKDLQPLFVVATDDLNDDAVQTITMENTNATPSSVQDCEAANPVAQLASPETLFSSEQNRVLEMVTQKQNVFFTGSAGRGCCHPIRPTDQPLHIDLLQVRESLFFSVK
jgi:hypothetical protein